MKKILAIIFALLFTAMPLSAQRQYSNSAARLYNEAIGAYRQRHFTIAKTKFNELLTKYENDGYADIARIHLAQLYRDTKENEKAIELYKEILIKNNGMHEIHMARKDLINLYFDMHRYKDGIDFIEEIRKKEALNEDINLKLADFYLQSGRGDEAWLLLQSLLETNGSILAFDKLLSISIKSGEIQKLMSMLEARRLRYSENRYIDFITSCHIALKEQNQAIEILKEYKNISKDVALLQKLTQLLMAKSLYKEAAQYLEMLVTMTPNNWNNVRSLGLAYHRQELSQKAIEAWKRPFIRNAHNRESIINLTAVLIEAQFYDEAIKVIDDYRKSTFDQAAFAVEKANILYATNRKNQAMEEYLLTFIGGFFKLEAFEKLYSEKYEGFSFKNRLQSLQITNGNKAITQALLELYFRNQSASDITEITRLIKTSDGNLDDMFYNRFCQDIAITENPFYHKLLTSVIGVRPNTSLELKLALVALKMTENYQGHSKELFEMAKKVADKNLMIDLNKNALLNIQLANYALYEHNNIEVSQNHLNNILNSQLLSTYDNYVIDALFIKTDTLIFRENFKEAREILDGLKERIESNIVDDITKFDYEAELILKEAYLSAHQGDYQGALTKLADIIDNYTDSKHINDALTHALYITQRSIGGDLEILNKSYKAEKLIYLGEPFKAIEELKSIITTGSQSPRLMAEIEADIILLKAKQTPIDELLDEINTYLTAHPEHHKATDILEIKISALLENKDKYKEAQETIKVFIETFPSDLRVAKYKNLISIQGEL
jgi:outer membrane protein assembly factor BamD (BamD/ComL family)